MADVRTMLEQLGRRPAEFSAGYRADNGIVVKAASGELVTTTLAIASGTENTHEAVIKLVRKHLAALNKFREVRFEIRLY